MSDLGQIAKDAAKDLAEAGEKAGKAVAGHFGDIGKGLKDAKAGYQDAEAVAKGGLEDVLKGGAKNAESAASNLGRDTAAEVRAGASGAGGAAAQDAENLAADSTREAEEASKLAGSHASSQDPVDLITGQMYLPLLDVLLPGVLPLELRRRHLSGYAHGRWFGARWASTLDQRVELDEDGVHLALEDGRVLHYPVPTVHGQRVLPSFGPRWPLAWDRGEGSVGGDEIRIEQGELGRTLLFAPGPTPEVLRPLSAVADRNGNRLAFVYDGEGVPTDVYHSGGYHVRVATRETRGGVRVESLRLADPDGGADTVLTTFRYDPGGRLIETADAGGQPLVFEYDESDRMTRWLDRLGHEYRYAYRADGRVTRVEGSGGYLASEFAYDLEARTTTMTDALGHRSTYTWDEHGALVETVDELGGRTRTEQDLWGNLLVGTDPLGQVTRITRNEFGDPTAVVRPDGSTVLVEYNALRLPVRVTGPGGEAWSHEYDERGNAVAVTDPTGARSLYAYDEHGGVSSHTDALGVTTHVECDRAGLPVETTDPLGRSTRFRRDRFGQVELETDAIGSQTRYRWDHAARPTLRRYPDGSEERWEYDPEGNLRAHTDAAGGVTRFEYGPFDMPVARVDPDGARFAFGYDAMLNLTQVTAPTGARWTYAYDAAGHVVAETDFSGVTRRYTLDAVGRPAETANATGQRVRFERDPLGRLVTRQVDGQEHRYAYDAAGNLVRAEAPGSVLEFSYDARGRLLTESHNGRVLTNTYDAAGRRTARHTPSDVLSQWTYDDAGRPARLAGTHGGLAFAYDAVGRETRRDLGPTASLTQSFDMAGRLTAQAIWAFDQPSGGGSGAWRSVQTRTYAFRRDGIPVETAEQIGGTRRYTLDAVGRVTRVADSDGREEAYAYDALGSLTLARLPTAAARAGAVPPDAAEQTREIHGTQVRRTDRSSYEYDAAGRVVRRVLRTLSGQLREWTYTWDADDRLTGVTGPDGRRWRYRYDAFGRRVAKERLGEGDDAIVEQVWFCWDGPRLAEEVRVAGDGFSTATTWDYEPGTVTPAAQTRRTWASDAAQPEIDVEFRAVVTDLVGTPQELVAPDGRVTRVADRRSLWGEELGEPAAVTPLGFPGHYQDAETGLAYNVHRYYNADTGAYLSPDPLGLPPAPNPNAYVENPLVWLDPLGLAPVRTPKQTPQLRYVTYTKTNPTTGTVYTGRSRGTGTPAQVVRNRDADHHMTEKGYGPAVLDQSTDATLPVEQRHQDPAYQAMRGREQQMIDHNGGARSMDGTSGNAINGIAEDNKLRDTYLNAATNKFGRV